MTTASDNSHSLNRGNKTPIPPYRIGSTITPAVLFQAVCIAGVILLAFWLWHYRSAVVFWFKAAFTDDMVGELMRESANAGIYGWQH